jgi:hypothetical protein
LCGSETWSLALREEHELNVLENRMLRGIFGLKRDEIVGKTCIMSCFITCTLHKKELVFSGQGRCEVECM